MDFSADTAFYIERKENERVFVLAGNPNVGKSTLFNHLTGMKQHTGNWTGKTVQNAAGRFKTSCGSYVLADVPGTYSLLAHSAEEETARDLICFGSADGVIVVCDAGCLERNLNLVLQILEITSDVIVCVNLLDEARKKHISVDLKKLEKNLGVPVYGITARSGEGTEKFIQGLDSFSSGEKRDVYLCRYSDKTEAAVNRLAEKLEYYCGGRISPRWAALRLLEGNESLVKSLSGFINADPELMSYVQKEGEDLEENISDEIIDTLIKSAEKISADCVTFEKPDYYERDRKIDRILTHRIWGVPIMAGLLLLIFWITISAANYPSQLLSALFDNLGAKFRAWLEGSPCWLESMLCDGIYRVLTWVISVMLPPMAIFFPLFTLLEDLGYLPRVAFNLDRSFKRAGACGKQALTMAMGFGCNAAGVTGCRIIDSPRERLIAVLTNSFVPCNGRFPALIAVITMFFAGNSSLLAVTILTAVIIGGILLTLAISKLLSSTVLKGVPSSFTLELPPYRPPQICSILVRSMLDRTVFVLGRAIAVAAPAGLVIWLLGNVDINGAPLLTVCSDFLTPFASVFGLDGAILLAFILGFPANEIVIPLMLMIYMSSGTLTDYESLDSLKQILVSNGWTATTAVCTLIFMLCHFPCSTTMLTIKKETGSLKWTALAFFLPLVAGLVLCFAVTQISKLL